MKKLILVLAMTLVLPLAAYASEKPAEHAGKKLKANCSESSEGREAHEECKKIMEENKNKVKKEHGGKALEPKPAKEHGGKPIK